MIEPRYLWVFISSILVPKSAGFSVPGTLHKREPLADARNRSQRGIEAQRVSCVPDRFSNAETSWQCEASFSSRPSSLATAHIKSPSHFSASADDKVGDPCVWL